MPALTSITVDDRESTPVAHVYVPTAPNGDVEQFVESDGVPIGDNKLSLSLRVSPSGVRKSTLKMSDPVTATETINGVDSTVKIREGFATTTFSFADSSTPQERANLIGKHANALAADQAFINSVIADLEGMY